MPSVLYLCDRRACKHCSPECHHTSDIAHAKNFELGIDGITMVESPEPILVLKTNTMLKKDVLDKIREKLMSQITTGVVFLDPFIEPIKVSSGAVVYDVFITERKENSRESNL